MNTQARGAKRGNGEGRYIREMEAQHKSVIVGNWIGRDAKEFKMELSPRTTEGYYARVCV